jgi:uncharacterized protein CbrC (UPF0167 family)
MYVTLYAGIFIRKGDEMSRAVSGASYEMPTFKYVRNPIENQIFSEAEEGEIILCDSCGKQTHYYETVMYCEAEVDAICPECIANGAAAAKFEGTFIETADEARAAVPDPAKQQELLERTPGLNSWNPLIWLAHCDDYCAFVTYAKIEQLEEMGIADEVLEEFQDSIGAWETADGTQEYMYGPTEDMREFLSEHGGLEGVLFQCLHCGKYRLNVDGS